MQLLFSETDDEGDDKKDDKVEEEKAAEAKKFEPTEWACNICTFNNSVANATCDVCGQG